MSGMLHHAQGVADPSRESHAALLAEYNRRRWAADPVLWVRERLGQNVWWAQAEILRLVRDHRRVAIQSANGLGKTRIAAIACCWWLDTHKPGEAQVVTSAKTITQVRTRLWKEIHRIHEDGGLLGTLNQIEWYMPVGNTGRRETVAIGVKPADNEPDALKGFHAPAILVIFDEAQSMDKMLWSAAGTIITSMQSRFLAIGNPDNPLTQFAEVCKPGSNWKHMKLSAFDSPNFYTAFVDGTFVGEVLPQVALDSLVSPISVDDMINEWGMDHPFVISQVFGEFPEMSDDALIPMMWVRNAQERKLDRSGPIEAGVDVGGGINRSVIVVRFGPVAVVEINKVTPDTSKVVEDCILVDRKYNPSLFKIDAIGIGNNVAAILASGQLANNVKLPVDPVNVGSVPRDNEKFGNLRAEGYWHLREQFRTGNISIPGNTPDGEHLAAELVDLRYRSVAGRIYIESKDEMKRRGRPSPDLADALMLAFLPPETKKKWEVTW